MLIKNAKFVITSNKVLKDHDILISNNTIIKVGKKLEHSGEIIDATGKLVMPGLVNTHNHFPMVLFRGAGDDMPLMEWLEKMIWPRESKMSNEDITLGAELALLEMIRSGTTSFADMYWYSEESVEAIEKAGIKAVLSWAIVDKDKTSQKGEPLKLAESFIKKWSGDPHIMPSVGPHAIYTCSKETLLSAKELAEKYGVLLHTHVSETETEVKNSKRTHKMRPVEYLDKIGFFGHDTLAAHCVHVDENEMKILAKNDVSVSHCPASNMKLASGVMPFTKLHDVGVNISLGTDGAASNNTLDMFDSMRLASLLHKVKEMNPTTSNAIDIFKAATINGANALNLNTGEIKPGKDADLLILDINKPHWNPIWNPVSNLVYSSKSTDVETVISNGNVVLKEGLFTRINEDNVLKRIQNFK